MPPIRKTEAAAAPGWLQQRGGSLARVDERDDEVDGDEAEPEPHETGVPKARDEDRFEALSQETVSALALTRGCVAELMDFKDVLLQHSFPGALRARLLLLMSRLHRSVSDVQVPAGELSRLTLVYSSHWHRQSEALRTLHEHCQMKQRLLDVAMRRLQLVHEQVRRVAEERKLLRWEKMFMKMTATEVLGAKWPNMMASFMEEATQRGDVRGVHKTSCEGFSKGNSDEDVDVDDDDDDEDDGDDQDMFMPTERHWRKRPAPMSMAPHRREFGTQTDATAQTDTDAQADTITQTNADTQTDARAQTDTHTQTQTGAQGDAGTQTKTAAQSDGVSQTDRISHIDTGVQTDTDVVDEEYVTRPDPTGQADGTLLLENVTCMDAASQTEAPAEGSLELRTEETFNTSRLPTPKPRSTEETVEGSERKPQADAWARRQCGGEQRGGGRRSGRLLADRRSEEAARIEGILAAHGRLAPPGICAAVPRSSPPQRGHLDPGHDPSRLPLPSTCHPCTRLPRSWCSWNFWASGDLRRTLNPGPAPATQPRPQRPPTWKVHRGKGPAKGGPRLTKDRGGVTHHQPEGLFHVEMACSARQG
ncbi:uncharacterized protein LOC116953161 isoform X2 [Petromyzon marinus]|uniref:uncharacterized protein LOC116953161 isoform X2 n=1 Tax=Petromyzon marinus TaxID=7757 RepID=UPI003F7102C4